MKFFTFFTKGFYEDVANKYVIPSFKKFNIEIQEMVIENKKDWALNTRLKAACILNALTSTKDDICMIDADAQLVSQPEILLSLSSNDTWDVSCHMFDWWKYWRNIENKNIYELISSVICFKNTIQNHKLVERWITSNQLTPSHIPEQRVFQNLTVQDKSIRIFNLPFEYCCIVNRQGQIPSFVKTPVIVQHQISRVVKRDKMLLQRGD